MKLIIIRHGETIENIKGICQGQTEGGLSENGINQSILLANEIKKYNIDLIYSSPLNRALKTTQFIQKHFKKLKINTDFRLTERNLASLQGNKFPKNYSPYKEYIDAESIETIFYRIDSFVKNKLCLYSNKTVLIVSHGITIIVLMAVLNNIPIKQIKTIFMVNNASVSEYNIINKNKTETVKINYTKHLFHP
jgi:broad specificity phosphatase PhoE